MYIACRTVWRGTRFVNYHRFLPSGKCLSCKAARIRTDPVKMLRPALLRSSYFYHVATAIASSEAAVAASEASAAVAPLPGVSTWYRCFLPSFVSSMVTVPVPWSGAIPNDLRFQR